MGLFAWNEKYRLGCAPIDDEHKRLFALADKLHVALAAGRGNDVLKSLFSDLLDYTATHFRHEEILMQGAAYPRFREHKAEHDALTSKAIDLQKQYASGKMAVTIETMRFLREWLDTHIQKTDRAVAAHVRSKAPQPAHAAR